MAELTGIGWCDSTANLWIGCSKTSGACAHCYAEDLMGTEGSRLKRVVWGNDGERDYCKQGWADLRKWQRAAARNGGVDPKLGRRRFVFINSLSDFFDNHKSVIWRREAWELFRECTHLVLILVTKRPQLIKRELPEFWAEIAHRVYIIATAEDQFNYDWRRLALLRAFQGRPYSEWPLLGFSIEPQLGPIDLRLTQGWCNACGKITSGAILGHCSDPDSPCFAGEAHVADLFRWFISGGESGDDARPRHPDWAPLLQRQCEYVGAAFFHKQHGEWRRWKPGDGDVPIVHVSARDGAVGTQPGYVEIPDKTHALGYRVYLRGDTAPVSRVGTKAAGNLLNGKLYEEFPDERMAA